MKKSQIFTQNVGLDMAKNSFVACLSFLLVDRTIQVKIVKEFKNTPPGFQRFCAWVKQHFVVDLPLLCTMEATGVYHEQLAYFLHEEGYSVSVVQPTQAKKYKESYPSSSKTDQLDARSLASMGLERKLEVWHPPLAYYQMLRDLTREREALKKQQARLKNQLHALKYAKVVHPTREKLITQRLELIRQQLKEVLKEIKIHLTTPNEENKDIIAKIKNVLTIPGVGYIVIATVLAETNGFLEIKNIRQLIHYAALVVKHHQSGEIKGKSYVSKKGNQHLKAVLFFPAFAAIRAADQFKEYYQKVTKTRNGTAGNLAVCRKVLTLIYTLWKNDTTYEPNYKGATSGPL